MGKYSDDFRASAVLMLEAAGWPEKQSALTEVAKHLGIQRVTLKRWATGEFNPPPNRNVHEKKIDLTQAIRKELEQITEAMGSAREDADYRALGTVFGILVDKLMLLENKPTERIAHDVTLTDEERANRINALFDTARTRRTGRAAERRTDD